MHSKGGRGRAVRSAGTFRGLDMTCSTSGLRSHTWPHRFGPRLGSARPTGAARSMLVCTCTWLPSGALRLIGSACMARSTLSEFGDAVEADDTEMEVHY